MEHLREMIDSVDSMILQLLFIRSKIVAKIAAEKKQNGEPIRNTSREWALIERMQGEASKLGLDVNVVGRIFQIIIEDSVNRQKILVSGYK